MEHIFEFEHFSTRHIGPSEDEINQMLKVVGVETLDELIEQTVPHNIRLKGELNIGSAMSEYHFIKYLKSIASKNKIWRSFIGKGYYNTFTPPVIRRNILENPGWYTQYTPYQAEISQGRLEALLNFQTMVSDLTGLPIANASLLDEGTAAAEAVNMFYNLRKNKNANKLFVSKYLFQQTIDVLRTRTDPFPIELIIGDESEVELNDEFFALIVQYPDSNGEVKDYQKLFATASDKNIFKIVCADILSLALLKSPGELGADAAVGSTQRFGVPVAYGGPHAAYFATKDEFKRSMPGRLIGVSIDAQNKRALRMALQTREQHIKREKATSNICTAQVLLAIIAAMYAVYYGPDGLRKIATRINQLTSILKDEITRSGYKVINQYFFDTLTIAVDDAQQSEIRKRAEAKEINFWYEKNAISISLDETVDFDTLYEILSIFNPQIDKTNLKNYAEGIKATFPETLIRQSKFMTQKVFNSYKSETEMLRYIKSLEQKDLSLTGSMIPLGSCTMKLNATTEMLGITWEEFANIHPFVPLNQAEGYQFLISELSEDLKKITGFKGITVQPNSGAQGEFTGLMIIRKYHQSRGESQRNVVLIPSSAHGTNPASATLAGMKVVVVACDSEGDIDVNDLKQKCEQYKDTLAALMVTYPSTHGVFEEAIAEICDIIHKYGGQVYMDGANMNAQVGLTSPAIIGADLCHLNLHKTFAIPHGGGGPGVGPIAVAEHLIPFLPGHSIIKVGGEHSITAVASAPFGSAGVLPISFAYIKMMGGEGLTKASKVAILNANYVKEKLKNYYKTLYVGKNGRVGHELIFDVREFKMKVGIDVIDIAKRLMDYGIHAPTVSFPVPGTLMFEPTESESKYELDRFCDAMVNIRKEIEMVEKGLMNPVDNPLKNAPHTAEFVTKDEWQHPYTRSYAAFPLETVKSRKFWPSVARINDAYGDRNLVCTLSE